MPVLLLIVLLITVPITELYVIIEIGQAIGAPVTIGLLALSSVLGTISLRRQGRMAWRRFMEANRVGRLPHVEAVDGALIVLGGILLIAPGFVTDVAGLGLLIPLSRSLARNALLGYLRRRIKIGTAGVAARTGRRYPTATPDVEGSAVDITDASLHLPSPAIDERAR